jgi:hypothetical protein
MNVDTCPDWVLADGYRCAGDPECVTAVDRQGDVCEGCEAPYGCGCSKWNDDVVDPWYL